MCKDKGKKKKSGVTLLQAISLFAANVIQPFLKYATCSITAINLDSDISTWISIDNTLIYKYKYATYSDNRVTDIAELQKLDNGYKAQLKSLFLQESNTLKGQNRT